MIQSFFFYDLETSGLSPRKDRIMQFAGQRTDFNLNPLGDPINLLVKLPDDTLPSPLAIATTGITPQQTQSDGLTEYELSKYLASDIFTPGTVAIGYNSVRFDDEFIRHLFWRNFHDPYEWQWKDNRSKWDLLDVVRMVRALRPEGINWPTDPEGKATNRLELLTKANNIEHLSAHDALSDVNALISVTKLLKSRQPQMFEYLFSMRDKRRVQDLVNLNSPRPFVYTSGRYPSTFNKTTVALPLMPGAHGNIFVYDLRYNLDDLLTGKITLHNKSPEDQNLTLLQKLYPAIKELSPNKCPAVAPLGVLEKYDGWQKIQLNPDLVKQHLQALNNHPDFINQLHNNHPPKHQWQYVDAESALYDGFLSDSDRIHCNAVRNATPDKLADFHPDFADPRLPELLLHYKARNFPNTLTESEQQTWQTYRTTRLNSQIPDFQNGMKELLESDQYHFLAEELNLWYQSLL